MLEVKPTRDKCLSCCSPDKPAREVSINRAGGVFKGSNIVTITLCEDCLRILAKEFVMYSV